MTKLDKIVIWANYSAGSMYNILELIKNNKDNQKFHIIGSSINENSAYKILCDEFYVEDRFQNANRYVDWCLEFCKKHSVDLLIPRKFTTELSKRMSEFNELGTKVMLCEDYQLIEKLNDKIKANSLFEELDIVNTPPMIKVNNVSEFKEAYKEILSTNLSNKVCIKHSIDIGGLSYHLIEDNLEDKTRGLRQQGRSITYEQVLKELSRIEPFEDLIVMPFLEGPEISIDGLLLNKDTDEEQIIAVPRVKWSSELTEIDMNDKYISIMRDFIEKTRMTQPFNLQLRYHNGELWLLEVNTRMAGGIPKCNHAGINIPYIAVKHILGQPFEVPQDIKNLHLITTKHHHEIV